MTDQLLNAQREIEGGIAALDDARNNIKMYIGELLDDGSSLRTQLDDLAAENADLRFQLDARRPRAVECGWAWGHGKGLTDIPENLGVDIRQILRLPWQPFTGTPADEGIYNAERLLNVRSKYPEHLRIKGQPVVVCPQNFGLHGRKDVEDHPLVLEDFDSGDWKQELRERYLASFGPFINRLSQDVTIAAFSFDEFMSRYLAKTAELRIVRDLVIADIAAAILTGGVGPIDFSQYGSGGIGTIISISAYNLEQAAEQLALYWPQVESGKYAAMIPWLRTPGTYPDATDGYYRDVLRLFIRETGGRVRKYYFWNKDNAPGSEAAWRRFAEIEREITAEMGTG